MTSELDLPYAPLSRGSLGPDVKRLQEWLCFHGHHVAVDGDFGPATEAALKALQQGIERAPVGVADKHVWMALTSPLRMVRVWRRYGSMTTAQNIVDAALYHLHYRPREVGKPNGGPWVRYYCRGQEVPWCAGFTTAVLGQALGNDDWYTLSCDELALRAMDRGVLRSNEISTCDPVRPQEIRPGDLFIIRTPGLVDWHHCGIVTAVGPDHYETVEGNTNLDGSREGTAVHARTRAFKPNVDFVLTGGEHR